MHAGKMQKACASCWYMNRTLMGMSYAVFQMAIAFQRAEHLHIVLNLRHNVYLRLVHQILNPVHQPPHHLMNPVKKVSFAISVLGSMGAWPWPLILYLTFPLFMFNSSKPSPSKNIRIEVMHDFFFFAQKLCSLQKYLIMNKK